MSERIKFMDDFKVASRVRKLNTLVQIILCASLFIGLNFLAARHYLNWDASVSGVNSLSPESVAYVKNLKEPVEIFAVIGSKASSDDVRRAKRDLRSLFAQYEYISSKKAPVKYRFVQAHMESMKSEELARRFGADLENTVVIACGKKFKVIPISSFYTSSEDSQPEKFNGEQIVSSAILSVANEKEKKIYFLKGHGEMSIKSSDGNYGLSEFASMLKARNYVVDILDINEIKSVPEDADMLIVAGAQAAFLPREISEIRKYLSHSNGRMIAFLPLGSLGGFEDVLFDWGIMSDDKLILDSSGDYESSSGDLIARSFPRNPHAIVKYLLSIEMPVQFGSVRPVRQDMGAPLDDSLKLEQIILSGPMSWAENSYRRAGMQGYDDAVDLKGPVPLAMVASRTGGDGLGLKIPGGRLLVFGDENFIANNRFNRLGNSKLVMNAVDWMFDENSMLNIPPRKIDTYVLTLSLNEIIGLGWRFMIFPVVILLVSIFVWFARRN